MDVTTIVAVLGVLGTFAGVVATIYVGRISTTSSNYEFAVEDSSWVREHLEGNYRKFLNLLLSLDHAAVDGLNDLNTGNSLTKAGVFEKSQDTWSLVISRDSMIVGYWSFFSLSDKLVQRLKCGALYDSEITTEEVHRLNESRAHVLYFEMFAIHPSYYKHRRQIFKMLLTSLNEAAISIRQRGIQIAALYATGFSDQGAALCRDFGMWPIVKSSQGGDVYFVSDITIVEKNLRKMIKPRILSGVTK